MMNFCPNPCGGLLTFFHFNIYSPSMKCNTCTELKWATIWSIMQDKSRLQPIVFTWFVPRSTELIFDIECDGGLMIIPPSIGRITVLQRIEEAKCQENKTLYKQMKWSVLVSVRQMVTDKEREFQCVVNYMVKSNESLPWAVFSTYGHRVKKWYFSWRIFKHVYF